MPTAGQRDVCGILFDFTSMRDLICSSGVMCKFFQRGKVMEYSAYLQRFDDKPLCKRLGVICKVNTSGIRRMHVDVHMLDLVL